MTQRLRVVALSNGLGNQMFQHALIRSLEATGSRVCVTYNRFQEGKHNGFELERIFGLRYQTYPQEWSALWRIRAHQNWRKFRVRCARRGWGDPGCFDHLHPEKVIYYIPWLLASRARFLFLDGYWMSEAYMLESGASDRVRADFTFPALESAMHRQLADAMAGGDSVAVHVRRGDFMERGRFVGMDYYRRAISEMNQRLTAPRFYFFSDEPDWCRHHLSDLAVNPVFVEGSRGPQSFRDLHLMSLCRHHIIANSSFSWWGAWLAEHPEQTVIAPDSFDRCCPPRWKRLPTRP